MKVNVIGVEVDDCSPTALIDRIDEAIAAGSKTRVMSVNVNVANTAYEDPELRELINDAEIVSVDGYGIMLGAAILGKHLPDRMNGADYIFPLAERMEAKGHSIYLLGSEPGVAEVAQAVLLEHCPKLNILGAHHGYFDHEGPESMEIIEEINALKPDMLFVGFGTPVQERWIRRHWQHTDARVFYSAGGLFNLLAGDRAPRWVIWARGEWFYRMLIEPRRMWRRNIKNPVFLWRALMQRLGLLRLP